MKGMMVKMKEGIIIITVLIMTFVPNFFFKKYLETTGNEILELLQTMEKDIENGNGVNEETAKKLQENFLDKEKKWILFVDHEILDEIENAVEECIAFYNAEDDMEFESSSNKLKNSIEDLVKREEVSLTNIL